MVSEVQRIQNRSGLGSAQMARLLGVSVRMLVRWKTGDGASKTAEHRLRLLEHVVDSYGDQPPERIRYLLFAPKKRCLRLRPDTAEGQTEAHQRADRIGLRLSIRMKNGMTEPNANDDYTYRSQLNTAIDQLRLALETKDTGERIRLLNGALNNTGNAIGQLALFESNGSRRPERR